MQSKSCILIRASKKVSAGWRRIWFREEFGCLMWDVLIPATYGVRLLPLCQVPSIPCGTKEPEELFFLPYRVKAPRLQNKAALQVFQNSLKLPLKERSLDRLLASFPQSVPLPLQKERAASIDTCVWVRVSSCTCVYKQRQTWDSGAVHYFTEGLCLSWGPGDQLGLWETCTACSWKQRLIYQQREGWGLTKRTLQTWSCFFLAPNIFYV